MTIIRTFQESSADFTQNIELDGIIYNIRMTWNTRIAAWFMDILDQFKNPILLGIKLVPNYLLLRDYRINALPGGDFYFWDSENIPENFGVTFDNLGARYILIYFTEEECCENA